MKLISFFVFIISLNISSCQDINKLFAKINQDFLVFNQRAASIAWESSVNTGDPKLPDRAANLQMKRIKWSENVCGKLVALSKEDLLNNTQRRQTYLLCRGPRFTLEETREASSLFEELQSIYSDAKICIQTTQVPAKPNETDMEAAILFYLSTFKDTFPPNGQNSIVVASKAAVSDNAQKLKKKNNICLNGEEDVENMMKFSKNQKVLEWLWLVWREKVGPPMKEPYEKMVEIENRASQRNGYHDIGAAWRDELEIPNLRQLSRELFEEIRPLYTLLHGVVRFHLRRHYDLPERGLIPAHLLGDLWSQNWEPLVGMITQRTLDIDSAIKASNWSVQHILKHAEDFYQSLGLPAMPDQFWSQSVFERKGRARCHGTAADMFRNGDYRLLYCSGTSAEDLYVIHHEMGHIHYYMAYERQPAIFRNANSALHETIGDAIMYGVRTPQHIHRLGLVNDSVLFTRLEEHDVADGDEMSTDEILLLQTALSKIPQIPFALLVEEYRWKYFEGSLKEDQLNQEFWRMARELQGIEPPEQRDEKYFDIGAKFHVPDNTPYIRYFLSYFLQHQLFESLCKAAVFGRRGVAEDLPATISLDRCDIYGSKAAGKLLKDLMSRGHSQHWRQILEETIGDDVISADALKRYYRPLYRVFERMVRKHRIPIGW